MVTQYAQGKHIKSTGTMRNDIEREYNTKKFVIDKNEFIFIRKILIYKIEKIKTSEKGS